MTGQEIKGEGRGDSLGYSLDLSGDGMRLAVGAPGNDNSGTDAGRVRIFEYVGTCWVQLDQVDGEATYDFTGRRVALSSDGAALAIGAFAYHAVGQTRVFDLTACPAEPTDDLGASSYSYSYSDDLGASSYSYSYSD